MSVPGLSSEDAARLLRENGPNSVPTHDET